MNPENRNNFQYLLALIVAIAGCVVLARAVETDFGRVKVEIVHFPDPLGIPLVGKLYTPKSASPSNPLPGVLALHGFQNDKETQDAFAIELARRGFVVLALDQFGHGDSGGRMSSGAESGAIMGAQAGYQYLKELPFVDAANLGVMGHSMGASNTIAVGKANPDHQALNPQCGTPGATELNNVLLTQARYEEFSGFRENALNVKDSLTTYPERLADFGLPAPVEWDVTYGSFNDGSARRQTLVNTVHPGVTHDSKAVAETVLWMQQALKGGQADADWRDPRQQIYMWKELFTLLALLLALQSMIPLTCLLLATPFFAALQQPLPNRWVTSRSAWLRGAIVNNLIAGLTFPVLMGLGGYLLAGIVPPLGLIIGNGIFVWFLGNTLIYLVLFAFWYWRNKKHSGVTMFDLGISFDPEKTRLDAGILGKTVLLGVVLLVWLYALAGLSQSATGIEFRFLWPFMREFSAVRFGYFWLYLLPAVSFFLVNGGVFLFGQMRQPEAGSPARTQVSWWLKACLAALVGLLLIWVLQYLPYFAGAGPGFQLIGLPIFGEMIPLLLFVYIPEFIVLLFYLTWFYRKTGKVYLGALVIAALVIWWLTAGTAM